MSRQTLRIRATLLCAITLSISAHLLGCGQGSAPPVAQSPPTNNGTNNPIPTITSFNPSCAPLDGQSFTLVASGSGFVASSVVQWNGISVPTTFLGSFGGQLWIQGQVPASDLSVSGQVAVTVFNPPPGGGRSNTSSLMITAGGSGPQSIALDPGGKFAYVANEGCPDAFPGSVSMYTVDGATGDLVSVLPSVPADFGAHSVTVDPFGKFVYVANDGAFEVNGGSIFSYALNATTGALTSTGVIAAPCAPPPSPGSCLSFSVAVHPSGKFAYVANEGGLAPTSISMFTIDATTGALRSIGTIAAGGRAIAVTVDPTGKFVYAATESDPPGTAGTVSMYVVNSTTGALTSVGSIAAGTDPTCVAVDPTGTFTYVTNSGTHDVSMYTINKSTGALISLGQTGAEMNPSSVAVHPAGTFAYVTNSGSNDVSIYTIDTNTGVLTPTGSVVADLAPSSIAIHPSGKFAYVTNFGSNTISIYRINATTGALTLIGAIGA